jgi:hypothetical protein
MIAAAHQKVYNGSAALVFLLLPILHNLMVTGAAL